MDRSKRSFLNSLVIILLYYLAIVGIVKAFWYTHDEYQFEGRIKFLAYSIILITAICVFIPYHLFSISVVNIIYQIILIMVLAMTFTGAE